MNKIKFILDGKITEIDFSKNSIYKPTTTVLNYLRNLTDHKGVKEGCAEGDCGACTVVIAELDDNDKIIYKAIDSCLHLLPMLNGKQLITVEELAETLDNKIKLHPVQQAIVDNYGSQCGYCTPGIVMSMFALYKNFLKPTKEEILDALTGNLCRCTGYQAIIDAASSNFLEDKNDKFKKNEVYTIELLKSISDQVNILHINHDDMQYFIPKTIQQAIEVLNSNTDAVIVNGATDVALKITKKNEYLSKIIDLSSIKELKTYENINNDIYIGAGLSLELLRLKCKKDVPALYDMLTVFGAKQIRSVATIGGNVGSSSPIGDTLPVLMALNANITLQSINGKREVNINNYIKGYRITDRKINELIIGVRFANSNNSIIKSYKFSKRKDLDISTVSACFKLIFESDNIVKDIVMAFGGVAATTIRAKKTESFLIGKQWSENNVFEASKILYNEFAPISDARSGETARRIAARNLLIKFWSDTIK